MVSKKFCKKRRLPIKLIKVKRGNVCHDVTFKNVYGGTHVDIHKETPHVRLRFNDPTYDTCRS